MKMFNQTVAQAVHEAVRMFFAPVTGIFKAIKAELAHPH